MSIFKRTQGKTVKKAYRVRNWREYESGLRDRGSLTVWISLPEGADTAAQGRPARIGAGEQPAAQSQHCRTSSARQAKVAHRIGLQQTEQSRDNVPSLQGHRGLSDASERVGGTESRGQDRGQDSEHHDGARDA